MLIYTESHQSLSFKKGEFYVILIFLNKDILFKNKHNGKANDKKL